MKSTPPAGRAASGGSGRRPRHPPADGAARRAPPRRPGPGPALVIGLLLLLVLLPACVAPGTGEPPPATLEVTGLGWLRNRQLRQSLERLLGTSRTPVLSANAVDDALFLLRADVQSEGFLEPGLAVEWIGADGRKERRTLDADLVTTVPRGLATRAVAFHVTPGVRSYVRGVTFTGRTVLKESVARSFFLGGAALFTGRASRAYTPARLARARDGLQAEYRLRGYAEAEVQARATSADPATGAVWLQVAVTEGDRWQVATVTIEAAEAAPLAVETDRTFVGRPWTEALQQSLAGAVRTALYVRGYADARVRVTREAGAAQDGRRDVAVTVGVRPGEPVQAGRVRFEGLREVREEVLRRRVDLPEGGPLNPLEVDRSRHRLARLGVFEQIELRYDPPTGPRRHPVFTVREGRSLETNLFLGYGTYEQVRGAVELRQFNLFGRAHQSRLWLAQSLKSTRAEYTYTVPEIFGESLDGVARGFGLQRDELAFQRQEFGVTAALSLPVRRLGAHATAGYTLQRLRNRQNELATRLLDETQVTVAGFEAGLTGDRRDNPLRPRRGHRWFAEVEAASRALGGQAEYQRFEAGGSLHTGWGPGRWVHAALTHGVITTWGANNGLLPVNKRFFPGGAASIRGYRDGEASPRGASGRFVGAESYLLASLDLEQALAADWSVVLLGDALGVSPHLHDYPLGGEHLYSAGLGLRYQTLIGPIRIEYGRNLNPRAGDPGGTWQVSVGASF